MAATGEPNEYPQDNPKERDSEDLLQETQNTHAGYSGTFPLKAGRSRTYSLYSHFTLKCKFI